MPAPSSCKNPLDVWHVQGFWRGLGARVANVAPGVACPRQFSFLLRRHAQDMLMSDVICKRMHNDSWTVSQSHKNLVTLHMDLLAL